MFYSISQRLLILALSSKRSTTLDIWLYLQYYWADLAQTCSLGPLVMSRILSLRLIHAMHALTSTPFCVTGWPIVDNQLNSTFGNSHSLQPIGGIHYWLAYQQKRLDSNWTFCITLRQ